jgi:hypothetical protein
MNIFFLDSDPQVCAFYHGDKHVVKMVLETAQLLSTAHRIIDGTLTIENNKKHFKLPDRKADSVLYRATHANHPCAIWVRESEENYNWAYNLFYHLCKEYTYRYNKIHKTESLKDYLYMSPTGIKKVGSTKPALAMPDCYKTLCPIQSYRNYYVKDKLSKKIVFWYKNRPAPEWLIQYK